MTINMIFQALKYLDWISYSTGAVIQHAGNGLEKRIKNFKIDGWIEAENRGIEILDKLIF